MRTQSSRVPGALKALPFELLVNAQRYEYLKRFCSAGEDIMNVISRRDVMRSSGVILASPLVLSLRSQSVYAQTHTSSGAAAVHQIPFSKDLHNYVTDSMSQTIHKIRAGAVTPQDLLALSSQANLYARHVDSLGVDLKLSVSGSSENKAKLEMPKEISDRVIKRLSNHNPELSANALGTYLSSSPSLDGVPSDVHASVSRLGVADAMRSHAECFKQYAIIMRQSINNGQYRPAVFSSIAPINGHAGYLSPSGHVFGFAPTVQFGPGRAHLQEACVTKAKICATIAAVGTSAAATKAWLNSGWALFKLGVEAATGGAEAEAAFAAATAAATPEVTVAAGALEALADLAMGGPEAVILGLAVVAILAAGAVAYCVVSSAS